MIAMIIKPYYLLILFLSSIAVASNEVRLVFDSEQEVTHEILGVTVKITPSFEPETTAHANLLASYRDSFYSNSPNNLLIDRVLSWSCTDSVPENRVLESKWENIRKTNFSILIKSGCTRVDSKNLHSLSILIYCDNPRLELNVQYASKYRTYFDVAPVGYVVESSSTLPSSFKKAYQLVADISTFIDVASYFRKEIRLIKLFGNIFTGYLRDKAMDSILDQKTRRYQFSHWRVRCRLCEKAFELHNPSSRQTVKCPTENCKAESTFIFRD